MAKNTHLTCSERYNSEYRLGVRKTEASGRGLEIRREPHPWFR